MIVSMPLAIAALKGGASRRRHSALVWVMIGKPTWLSTSVSPCPGKCLAAEEIRASRWKPSTCAAAKVEARVGSEEKDRVPMTGLSGLTLTSHTGAKSVEIPIARSSRPVISAARRASRALRPAPRAMAPGNCVAGSPIRVTAPISWSIEIVSGIRAERSRRRARPPLRRRPRAARWRPLDSAVIWSGSSMLSVHSK